MVEQYLASELMRERELHLNEQVAHKVRWPGPKKWRAELIIVKIAV